MADRKKIEYREEILKELSKLISIPSVTGDREEVRKALGYALDLGKKLGFKAGAYAGGRVGVIEWGEGPETLGILAHVDVVPPGPLEEWSTDPYEAVMKDGRIFGRGTMDDKGMVITCLFAMKAASDRSEEEGIFPKKKVQLIIGTQEEGEWEDMYDYVTSNPLPDYGFTPDGEFPYANIEKGIVDMDMEFDIPEESNIRYIEAGTVVNAIPSFACAVMADGSTIEATGNTCHSCDPTKGENAIFNLLNKLKEAGEYSYVSEVLEMVQSAFADCYGSTLPIYKKSEYFRGEWVHRTVFSPTVIRTNKNKLHVVVDVRFAYGTEPKDIVDFFDEFARKLGGCAKTISIMPAVFVPRDRPFLKVFDDAYNKHSGISYSGSIAMGGSYAKTMPNIVSWGPAFPGDEDFCHQPNESIGIETIEKCFRIYREAIETILFSNSSFV